MSESDGAEPAHSQDVSGVRVVMLHLPEDEGEGLGFKLTRTLWDPYPWVREVAAGGRAAGAGLRSGDCVLQADGRDLLGLAVGQVAGLIRGDGGGRGVSLLVWSCGTSPQDDPELLWSAGGGARGERSRRALSGVLKALSCVVCSATAAAAPAPRAAQCTRGHLYCAGCRARLQRCALCRETLPAVDAPQARNLVAEQVFEAIAAVYELKESSRAPSAATSTSPLLAAKAPRASVSQRNSPSPLRKTVQFGLNAPLHHGSDVSLNRPLPNAPDWSFKRVIPNRALTLSQDMGSQTDLDFERGQPRDSSVTSSSSNLNQATRLFQQNMLHGCCQNTLKVKNLCQNQSEYYHQNSSQNKNTLSNLSDGCHQSTKTHYCQNSTNSEIAPTIQHDGYYQTPETHTCDQSRAAPQSNCQTQSCRCHEADSTSNCSQNRTSEALKQSGDQYLNQPDRNQETTANTCCQKKTDEALNQSPSHCDRCHMSSECHSSQCGQQRDTRLLLSQEGLNLVPASACALRHRLVTRLRPACSLADLTSGAHCAGGLSKSCNDIRAGHCVLADKCGSVDNLKTSSTLTQLEGAMYVMAPSPPLYVWAYQS